MNSQSVIAITLGSNGFHLFDVQRDGNKLETNTHLYSAVQAETYINGDNELSESGIQHILTNLLPFAEYLEKHREKRVGVIATGTFRRAVNCKQVVTKGSEVLGVPINVISGRDESLLCYMGIASALGVAAHNRFVIDIGGGSTELMIARQNTLIEYVSLDLGCVSLTKQLFDHGGISVDSLQGASEAVQSILKPHRELFLEQGWQESLGCGGTVSSIYSVLQQKRMAARFITPASLDRFEQAVLESGSCKSVVGSMLPEQRIELLPAGYSILKGIITTFEIEKLLPAFSSVAQGFIVQLINQLG